MTDDTMPRLDALPKRGGGDVIAYLAFPKSHWPKLHSTNPIDPSTGSG